jgi:hypothetical protein
VGLKPVGPTGLSLSGTHLIRQWTEVDFEWIYWEENGMVDGAGNPVR